MTKDAQALWGDSLSIIRKNVTPQEYDTWFEPIVLESFNEKDRTLLVQVSSHYIYEYIEQHYIKLLLTVLTRCFGNGISLKYRIVTDRANNISQDVETEQVADIEPRWETTRANKAPTMLDAAVPQEIDSQLSIHHTFNNFIEGDSNKLPRTVGISIAEHPGRSTFNPFFVFGPSGCGKTHLINAIGVRCKEIYPSKRVLYVSARLFQVQFTDSVRQNTQNDFINFYSSLDMLIVDDIQEWATATKTLDTFFHIFNHLFRSGKQIILASDRPPVDLQGMKDRLLTRFSCGLIAELEQPNLLLRKDILKSKCRRDGLKISDEVIELVAQSTSGSVRDLEGVINSLLAYSVVYNKEIDCSLAETILKRAIRPSEKQITPDDIIEEVCSHYNVTRQSVMSKSRKRELVNARQVSMYITSKLTKMPTTRIGQLIGGRDHATVIHSCSTVERRMKVDKAYADDIINIENSLKTR